MWPSSTTIKQIVHVSGFTSCTSQRPIIFSFWPTPPKGINSDSLAVSQKHSSTKPSATFFFRLKHKQNNRKPTTPKPEGNAKNRKGFAYRYILSSHTIFSPSKLNELSRLVQTCEKSGKHAVCWQFKKDEMGQVFSNCWEYIYTFCIYVVLTRKRWV